MVRIPSRAVGGSSANTPPRDRIAATTSAGVSSRSAVIPAMASTPCQSCLSSGAGNCRHTVAGYASKTITCSTSVPRCVNWVATSWASTPPTDQPTNATRENPMEPITCSQIRAAESVMLVARSDSSRMPGAWNPNTPPGYSRSASIRTRVV